MKVTTTSKGNPIEIYKTIETKLQKFLCYQLIGTFTLCLLKIRLTYIELKIDMVPYIINPSKIGEIAIFNQNSKSNWLDN